jgi:gamma-tubulin complex component 3
MDTSVDSPLSEEQPLYHREGLTLCRLAVWTFEPQRRMKCLAAVADACKNKKGGVLASCVHGFLQHGDPVVRDTVKNLLGAVSFFSHFENFIFFNL